jgi:tRNA (cytidine32/uridine32-2'-O)-methyltransferase
MLDNIRIILVSPTHPGNIGSVARAMKTMGLKQLYIVNPKCFPDPRAVELAAHAADVLEQARVVNSLPEALAGCTLIFGTSARTRALEWPGQDLRPAAAQAVQEANQHSVAFVFGREHAGLTNEELELCQYQIQIPANPEYSSLNLAAAVQIVCYELRMAWLNCSELVQEERTDWATLEEVELYYQHLERVLLAINFIKPGLSGQVIPRLRRLFSRTRLDKTEINILRGILTTMEKSLE